MTIIQQVRDVLEANAGTAMTTAEIEGELTGVKRDQINSALWRLRTEDDLIKQVRTGLHKYLGPSERVGIVQPTAVHSSKKQEMCDPEEPKELGEELEEKFDEHLYFTQVGVAENGDLILSRDSDTRVYRATPV